MSQVEGVLLKQVRMMLIYIRFRNAKYTYRRRHRDEADSDGIRDTSDVMRLKVSCIIGSWMILVVNRKVYGI